MLSVVKYGTTFKKVKLASRLLSPVIKCLSTIDTVVPDLQDLAARVRIIECRDDFDALFSCLPFPVVDSYRENTLEPKLTAKIDAAELFVNKYASNLMLADVLLSDCDIYSRYFFVYDLLREVIPLSPCPLSIVATTNALSKYPFLLNSSPPVSCSTNGEHDHPPKLTALQQLVQDLQFDHSEHENRARQGREETDGPQGVQMNDGMSSSLGEVEMVMTHTTHTNNNTNTGGADQFSLSDHQHQHDERRHNPDKTHTSTVMESDPSTNNPANSTCLPERNSILVFDRHSSDGPGRAVLLGEVCRPHVLSEPTTSESEAERYQFVAQLLILLMHNNRIAGCGGCGQDDSVLGVFTDGVSYQCIKLSTQYSHNHNTSSSEACGGVYRIEYAPLISLLNQHMLPNPSSVQRLLGHVCSALNITSTRVITTDYLKLAFEGRRETLQNTVALTGSDLDSKLHQLETLLRCESHTEPGHTLPTSFPDHFHDEVVERELGSVSGKEDVTATVMHSDDGNNNNDKHTAARRGHDGDSTSPSNNAQNNAHPLPHFKVVVDPPTLIPIETSIATVTSDSTAATLLEALRSVEEVSEKEVNEVVPQVTVKTLEADIQVLQEELRAGKEEINRIRSLLCREMMSNGKNETHVMEVLRMGTQEDVKELIESVNAKK